MNASGVDRALVGFNLRRRVMDPLMATLFASKPRRKAIATFFTVARLAWPRTCVQKAARFRV